MPISRRWPSLSAMWPRHSAPRQSSTLVTLSTSWGVQSIDDPGWNSNFENIYTAPALHNLWYCALGNHDYQGNTSALLDYTHKSRRWNMPARYYTRRFEARGTSVEVIVLDTTPFLRRTQCRPDTYPDVAAQDTAAQTQWLRHALSQADADWVIVAAHHPVYSCRPDNARQRADIQAHIAPVLAERRPDLYISGDVHCFEHYTFDGDTTDYITCSSGSQGYPIVTPDPAARFGAGVSGFMTIAADRKNCTVTMFDRDATEIYTYTRSK